ncbi:hypothetical protein BH23GEM9_BH23GEM9_34600 [soil metagenome]
MAHTRQPRMDMPTPEILYRNGLAVLRYVHEAPPFMEYDARADAYVAPGHRLAELRAWAAERGIFAVSGAAEAADAGAADAGTATGAAHSGAQAGAQPLFDPRTPRDYQRDAVDRWLAAGGRGSVVLPTGAGKSFVAILALHATGACGCVCCADARAGGAVVRPARRRVRRRPRRRVVRRREGHRAHNGDDLPFGLPADGAVRRHVRHNGAGRGPPPRGHGGRRGEGVARCGTDCPVTLPARPDGHLPG